MLHIKITVAGIWTDEIFYQKDLDDDFVDLVQSFLNRHEQPICLVAHNGNKFDFPVFKSELQNISRDLHGDIFCADTLLMFREITDDSFRSVLRLVATPTHSGEIMFTRNGTKLGVKRKLDYSTLTDDDPKPSKTSYHQDNTPSSTSISECHLLSGIKPLHNEENHSDLEDPILPKSPTTIKNSEAVKAKGSARIRKSLDRTDWPEDVSDGDSDADLLLAMDDYEEKAGASRTQDTTGSSLHTTYYPNSSTPLPKAVVTNPSDVQDVTQSKPFPTGDITPSRSIPNGDVTPSRSIPSSDVTPTRSISNVDVTPSKHSSSSTKVGTPRKSYALAKIYERVYGCEMEKAHSAESDCMAMLRIAEASYLQLTFLCLILFNKFFSFLDESFYVLRVHGQALQSMVVDHISRQTGRFAFQTTATRFFSSQTVAFTLYKI